LSINNATDCDAKSNIVDLAEQLAKIAIPVGTTFGSIAIPGKLKFQNKML